jgi:hypothetical protein
VPGPKAMEGTRLTRSQSSEKAYSPLHRVDFPNPSFPGYLGWQVRIDPL